MSDFAFRTLVVAFFVIQAAALAVTIARIAKAETSREKGQRLWDLAAFAASLVIGGWLLLTHWG